MSFIVLILLIFYCLPHYLSVCISLSFVSSQDLMKALSEDVKGFLSKRKRSTFKTFQLEPSKAMMVHRYLDTNQYFEVIGYFCLDQNHPIRIRVNLAQVELMHGPLQYLRKFWSNGLDLNKNILLPQVIWIHQGTSEKTHWMRHNKSSTKLKLWPVCNMIVGTFLATDRSKVRLSSYRDQIHIESQLYKFFMLSMEINFTTGCC